MSSLVLYSEYVVFILYKKHEEILMGWNIGKTHINMVGLQIKNLLFGKAYKKHFAKKIAQG